MFDLIVLPEMLARALHMVSFKIIARERKRGKTVKCDGNRKAERKNVALVGSVVLFC